MSLALLCSLPDEGRPVFLVDFPDLLDPVDIRLINRLYPAAAEAVASGTEFAVASAKAVKRLTNDLLPLFPGRVLDEDRSHSCLPVLPVSLVSCILLFS